MTLVLKTRTYSVYCHLRKRKTAHRHIREAETGATFSLLLKMIKTIHHFRFSFYRLVLNSGYCLNLSAMLVIW